MSTHTLTTEQLNHLIEEATRTGYRTARDDIASALTNVAEGNSDSRPRSAAAYRHLAAQVRDLEPPNVIAAHIPDDARDLTQEDQ